MKRKNIIIGLVVFLLVGVIVFQFLGGFQANQVGKDDASGSQNGKSLSVDGSQKGKKGGNGRAHRAALMASMNGEEKIDHVLSDKKLNNEDAVRILLGVVSDEKEVLSVREDALEHTLNLIEDDSFDSLLALMRNTKGGFPESLEETVLDDTMNRDENIQLATALTVLDGGHAKVSEEAKELLEFYIEESYGDDISKWNDAVDRYLKKKAEEKEEDQ